MPSNTAAWSEKAKDQSLVVRSSPYTSPGKGQVLIKNSAVAVNPIDWKIQTLDVFKSTYPLILGADIAGEIVEVGEDVTGFSIGQRVFAHAANSFQHYTNASTSLVTKIPDSLPFTNAVVLGLSVATAAAGLYQKEYLGLNLPPTNNETDEVVIVWGGSSSVGSSAIQLAKNSGYKVFSTSSKNNLKYLEELGAKAFDYHSETIVDDILDSLKGKKLAGSFDSISSPVTLGVLSEIASKSNGNKFIASTNPRAEPPKKSEGVTIKGVFATAIAKNEVGPAVFNDFLPKALAEGKFLAKPDPEVIGSGLEHIQEGIDKLKAGVSATKIVISL